MNKTSCTKIFFFLLVGIEHINASSSNLRNRKAAATTTHLIDAISSIFIQEDWSCCDDTDEPTPVPTLNIDVPTSSSATPTLSVTISPTTLRPTNIPTLTPTASPTYDEKKLTASDGANNDKFGASCSMSGELIVIGAPHVSSGGAAYLYHLNGNEVSKLTAGDDAQNYHQLGQSVSVDEKVVVGAYFSNFVQVFSLEGDYERSIICDECSFFGRSVVATYGERVVISGFDSSWNYNLYIYTTEGELLKTIDNVDEEIEGVDISDEVIVFTMEAKTIVYKNTAPDFEKIVEITQGGYTVATSGDRVVIGDYSTNNTKGAAWLYETNGTFIRTLEHNSQYFGSSVDITDDNIIVGTIGDDEGATNVGSVFIYSALIGEFQEKVLPPDGKAYDYFGGCVSATDSYLVVGAYGDEAAFLFPLSD